MGDGDNQYKKYKGFKILRGDASNPTFGILVDDASEALHVCDPDDQNTDWNVSAYSHPTVVVHSATTPATDYLILYHDATNGYMTVTGGNLIMSGITNVQLAISGTSELTLTATALSPTTSGGNALGTGSLMWSGLFLADGAVINFNNGAELITHSTNLLTITGSGITMGASAAPSGDFILYGTQATLSVWFDVNGDTNGKWYFGADDYGFDVAFYGQTASNSMLWDASANALVFVAGGITMGTGSTMILPRKAAGSTTAGDIWIDSDDNKIHYYSTAEYYTTVSAA